MKIKSILLSSLVFLSSCGAKQQQIKKTVIVKAESTTQPVATEKMAQSPAVTVWVHGSTMTLRSLSQYIHASPLGLHKITEISQYYRLKSMAKILDQADHERFPLEHFYAFGWPGNLDFELRKNEGKRLYELLKRLRTEYIATYGTAPTFRIITHSHGGNICLNLARAQQPGDDLTIEEAILLACPVQHETEHLAQSSIFKKVYSLYSTIDTLQVADPQGLYDLPSNKERKFEFSERQFPDSDNLLQARLKINKHGLLHLGFITKSFVKMLPAILNELNQWNKETPYNNTPKTERILSIKTGWLARLY